MTAFQILNLKVKNYTPVVFNISGICFLNLFFEVFIAGHTEAAALHLLLYIDIVSCQNSRSQFDHFSDINFILLPP